MRETKKNDAVLAELERIEETHGGIVTPQAVVEFARDPTTALHSRFDWEDSIAAAKWRLEQARSILRVAVKYVGEVEKRPIAAFVSLGSDRIRGGGYRSTVRVLDDDEKRGELLEQAKQEARAWADRYKEFNELARIRMAIVESLAG